MNRVPEIFGHKITGIYLVEPMRDEEYVRGKPFYSNGVVLEPVYQNDPGVILWAIRRPYQSPGQCLNKNSEWEFEPIPSNRTEEFYQRCRFSSMVEAFAAWDKLQEKR